MHLFQVILRVALSYLLHLIGFIGFRYHSSRFWRLKCESLSEELKAARRQLREQEKAHSDAVRVYLSARVRAEELEDQLCVVREQFEKLCNSSSCSCTLRSSTGVLRPNSLSLPLADIDDEDEHIDFEVEGKDKIYQLLVSHANSASITLALYDLMQKADKLDEDCLMLTTKSLLLYLQNHHALDHPHKTLKDLVKVYNSFMNPDAHELSEKLIISIVEEFIDNLEDQNKINLKLAVLNAFNGLGIINSQTIIDWSKITGKFEELKPWLEEISDRCLDCGLDMTMCDSKCDCESIGGDTTYWKEEHNMPSNSSTTSSNETEVDEKEPIHHVLKWNDTKFVREFYLPTDDDVETHEMIWDSTCPLE